MNTKCVLLTSGRSPVTLEMARFLNLAGHRVVVVDSLSPALTQFSSYIDRYYQIAKLAEQYEKVVEQIQHLVKKEQVDLVIPMSEEVLFFSKMHAVLPCPIFTMDFEMIQALHHKGKFYELMSLWGVAQPKTWLIQDESDLNQLPQAQKLIFKKVYSRFAAGVLIKEAKEVLPHLEYEAHNPYIAQEFIRGKKLCVYAIAQQGNVGAYAEYEVLQSIGVGSGVAFISTYHDKLFACIKKIVKQLNYTGQISFDFILDEKGIFYCIECNPRAISGLHLFEKNTALEKVISGMNTSCLIVPPGVIKRDVCLSLWYGVKQGQCFNRQFWRLLLKGTNPLWWRKDKTPFLALPAIFFHIIKMTLREKKGFHEVMSRDFEYNGEGS